MITKLQKLAGYSLGILAVFIMFGFVYWYAHEEPVEEQAGGDIATSTATSTIPEIIPEPEPSIPVLSTTQIEDEYFEVDDQYNSDGLLVSQSLYAEDVKLTKDKLTDYKENLTTIQLQDTDLKEAEVLTLYVRGIGVGTATLKIGDAELITLNLEDKKWLTKWDSINVSALGVSRFTQGQINNAIVEFTGDIKVSNIRLYAEDQHSLTDNFDSYNDGDLNGQGSWSGNATFDIQGTTKYEGDKAVTAVVSNDWIDISKSFTSEVAGVQSAKIRCNAQPTGSSGAIRIHQGAGAEVANVYFAGDRIQIDRSGGNDYILQPYSADTWYEIEIEWDAGRGANGEVRARARIAEGTWGSWSTWATGSNNFTAIDKIYLATYADTAYWDDFKEGGASAPPVLDDAGSMDTIWFD